MKNKENQEKTYTKKATNIVTVSYQFNRQILLDPNFLYALSVCYRGIGLDELGETMDLASIELGNYLDSEDDS